MYKYFSISTDPLIKCQCDYGCGLGLADMNEDFMKRLDQAREFAGVPFHITSGIRCPLHNNDVSTTGLHGPHTTGRAVDIYINNNEIRFLIRRSLILQGFHRFGTGSNFLHVDDSDEHPPNREWLY